VALPASARDDFGTGAEREQVGSAIHALASNAEQLEEHMRGADDRTRSLSHSAAHDARELARTWDAGRRDRTAFLLRVITENCVACHTRLPYQKDSPVAESFVQGEELAALAPEARAGLQMATRRFDDALATIEAILASPESPALLLGPLTDYLVVSIRVKGDYERPRATLERFAARGDLWPALRAEVEGWIEALPQARERAASSSDPEVAHAMLEEAGLRAIPAEDRSGLVQIVAASGILERFVHSAPPGDERLGRAYFELGIIEARIGRNYWVSEAPFLLETSIRIAPASGFAREAYAILERELLAAYEGSDVEELPAEDAARLAELRALIEGG
jgi:hypothetical protein